MSKKNFFSLNFSNDNIYVIDLIYLQVRGSPFAADKRRGFRLWRQRARRRAQQKSEGSANENGTNDENEDDQKVCKIYSNYCNI